VPEEERALRLFPAGAGRLQSIAAVDLDAAPRPWTITATVRNALGLQSPPQTAPFQIVDGNFPFQRLNIQAELVPLVEPQVRVRENLTLAAVTAETQPEPLWHGRFLQPVSGTLVTVHGARRTYVDPAGRDVGAAQHTGVDLGTAFGNPITATADGIVAFTGTWSIKGNVVVVDHGAGVHSVYGHASRFAVAAGDRVTRGQTIAYIGTTGLSTGPHLHWEMRVGGIAVEPLEWPQRADLALA
jgi:murein DD-endopeptidase MepM/ murein hydrolase activator NlpD